MSRVVGIVVAVLLACGVAVPAGAQTDRQVRGYFGATFAGDTSFADLTKHDVASRAHLVLGAQAAWLGEILGVDVDVADVPGFFQTPSTYLVTSSRVTTITGDAVVALPRRWAEYSLRLYFVGGGGIMRVREESPESPPVISVSKVTPAIDYGFGALGFLTNRVGLSWELRRFQLVGGSSELVGTSFGPDRLSYWRAHMAVVVRY